MRWQGREESSRVEDRRGVRGKGVAGIGGLGVVVLIVYTLMGGNPADLLQVIEGAPQQQTTTQPYQESPEEERLRKFSSVVLRETELVWADIFSRNGHRYQEPTLVIYSGQVQSGCGLASSGVGPFYCPRDQRIYVDLSFYRELQHRFKAPGDFAMAYVLAHEVGHHVQHQLGILEKVQALRSRMSQEEYNTYSVRLELQADYLAGVWAHHVRNKGLLEQGDVEEAMAAASAVGDDAIQKQMRGYVQPETFTHGTSRQRMEWFMKGFRAGDLSQGDTFSQ